jgi:hypothetical protein
MNPYDRTAGAAEGASADDTAVIRDEIEETRAEMGETIDAIQERLSPAHIKDQVKEQVREQFHEATATVRDATIGKAEAMVRNAGDTINEARYGLMETIRQNPIPAALVGLGLGWMFMNRRSGTSRSYDRYSGSYDWADRGYARGANAYPRGAYSYRGDMTDEHDEGTLHRAQAAAERIANRAQEKVGNAVNQAQETAGSVVDQAQETASNLASQTQQAVGNLADQAQYQAQRVEDRFQQALYENPLAVGAVALALGTAVGFALPQTQRENELMGEARDNLIDRAQEAAQSTVQQVQQVAGEVIDQAQTTIQEQTRERGAANE